MNKGRADKGDPELARNPLRRPPQIAEGHTVNHISSGKDAPEFRPDDIVINTMRQFVDLVI